MKEIILFNRCLDTATIDFQTVNQLSIPKGIIVDSKCCNERILQYLQTLPTNYNSTFYQSWNDVISKSRMELAMDQVLHYFSTYGTNYTGLPYVPNDSSEVIDFTDCKVIKSITKEEIQSKIQSMFNSGIALKQETIEMCLELISELSLKMDYTSIRNKEVMMHVCKMLDILPSSEEEMVRYLIFLYTSKTLLIKSPEIIKNISKNPQDVTNLIERFGAEKLSQVFLRYKPLFLAMKKGNEKIINKLRKLAVKNHKPKLFGFWSQILSNVTLFPFIKNELVNLNNYKLIGLLNTILVRKQETGIMSVIVRNGKLFVTESNFSNKNYYDMVYDILYKELITRLSKKACKVMFNPNIELALPTSEKNFIGNVPFGSYVPLKKDSIIGINWKESDGARDIDLSLLDVQGNKLGWNASYTNEDNSLIYSGDMTSADPEATELFYAKHGIPENLVRVNLFNGNLGSKYQLFFASEPIKDLSLNHMIDPNNILFQTELTLDQKSNITGLFVNNTFFFMDLKFGDGAVSYGNEYTTKYIEHMKKTHMCYLNLKSVLIDAGFEVVSSDADIDLSILDKSVVINLLGDS